MSFCSSLQVTISGQLSAHLSYVSLELNGVIGVLGKVWKGFDFWKDSYVVHVPLKWHRGEKSISSPGAGAALGRFFHLLPHPFSPFHLLSTHLVFSPFITVSQQFHISPRLTDLS